MEQGVKSREGAREAPRSAMHHAMYHAMHCVTHAMNAPRSPPCTMHHALHSKDSGLDAARAGTEMPPLPPSDLHLPAARAQRVRM